MPKLNEIISDKSRKNLMEIKAKSVSSNYVGETPNLNSSLGVNAADGTLLWMTELDPNAKEELIVPEQEESKLSQFWSKNQNLLLGIGGALFGGGNQTSNQQTATNFPPPEDKKNNTWIWWVLGAIILIIIIVLVIRVNKK